VGAYLALMDDRYPPPTSTSRSTSPTLPGCAARPEPVASPSQVAAGNSHDIVLVFLDIAMVVVVIVAWFAILFTGRYPGGMFDFVEGVIRWHNRVTAYALVLVTDRYPPFRLAQ